MAMVELSRDVYRAFRNDGAVAPSDVQIALFDYRLAARKELEEKLGGKFWIGPDIGTTYDVTIPSNGQIVEIDVTLPYGDLDPFTDLHPYALSLIEGTTRSRFAQLGLEIPKDAFADIARTFYSAREEDETKRFGGFVPVRNWAARPIFMEAGTKFFSGIHWNGETVTGEDLYELVGKSIRISGEENETWRWWYGSHATGGVKDIKGIEFFIDEKSRSWVPSSAEPMSISDAPAANHNRESVDRYLHKPVPIRKQPTLVIAQTVADIELTSDIHGIVNMAVAPDGHPIGQVDTEHFQTNSVFIRGGNTYGKMRTETVEKTDQLGRPQTSLMQFVKA